MPRMVTVVVNKLMLMSSMLAGVMNKALRYLSAWLRRMLLTKGLAIKTVMSSKASRLIPQQLIAFANSSAFAYAWAWSGSRCLIGCPGSDQGWPVCSASAESVMGPFPVRIPADSLAAAWSTCARVVPAGETNAAKGARLLVRLPLSSAK